MKKTIKLTESELNKLVKKIIKESKERDYDYIDNLLGEYGLHPNYLWYEEFENSRSYDKDMSDDEYAEAIYEFIMDEESYEDEYQYRVKGKPMFGDDDI